MALPVRIGQAWVPGCRLAAVSPRRDLEVAGVVLCWLPAVLLLDRGAGIWWQRAFGAVTWALLLGLLGRESATVRAQVGVVVAFATAIEYTFSPLLGVYVYRLHNVPAFVPPGHGLVYLCALVLGRALPGRLVRPVAAAALLAGGAYALWGLLGTGRPDVLGAFWYGCLALFVLAGPSRPTYLGAFVVVTYLELLGTGLGTWTWQAHDPTGLVSIGNPPSGAAGGYAWFDLAGMAAAPLVLRCLGGVRQRARSRSSTVSCSTPLVASAEPPSGPGRPDRSLKRPPASSTTTVTAARSQMLTSGSVAMSTAPSATSM